MIHILDNTKPSVLISDIDLDAVSHCYFTSDTINIASLEGGVLSSFKLSEDIARTVEANSFLYVHNMKAEALSNPKKVVFFS